MTTFLAGPGFGGAQPGTRESAALQDIDSRTKSFVNRDFVKNIQWLNQSVDTLSAYTQKLQAGVESANQNALEQIQGFWADMFVLFAGLEPTGIDVGDVKYVLQGIGALLGINPDTPFPLNLAEAAWHLFSTYIIPLDQFTDVIFDAILAWAEELGLSPDFIASITELRNAIGEVTDSFSEFFNSLSDLLSALGFMDFSDLGEFLASLLDLFDQISLGPLKPVLSLLADLGIPFINGLTQAVNLITAFTSLLSGDFEHVDDSALPAALPAALNDANPEWDNPLVQFFRNFLSLFKIDTWLNFDFNPVEAIQEFVELVLKPTNLLAWLDPVTGLLPNFQAPPIVADMINTISYAIDDIPFVGDLVDPVFDAIKALLGIGNTAQATANTGLAETAAIWATIQAQQVPEGVSIVEDFNGPQSNSLPVDKFAQTYFGPGAGTEGLDGQGNSAWNPSGAGSRGCHVRHKTPLHTNYQKVAVHWVKDLSFVNTTQPNVRLRARINEAETDWVEAFLERVSTTQTRVRLGFYVAGVFTELYSNLFQGFKDGDLLELRAGTSTDIRQLVFLRNSVPICDAIDTSGTSVVNDVTHVFTGYTKQAGVHLWFVFDQAPPPKFSIFAAADRTPDS